jgi:hypothetical protein
VTSQGVVADFPLFVPTGQSTVQPPVEAEGLAVVGSVVDGESVVVDCAEDGGQEFDVVVGEGERDVAADSDAGGVHLVGGEVPALQLARLHGSMGVAFLVV